MTFDHRYTCGIGVALLVLAGVVWYWRYHRMHVEGKNVTAEEETTNERLMYLAVGLLVVGLAVGAYGCYGLFGGKRSSESLSTPTTLASMGGAPSSSISL